MKNKHIWFFLIGSITISCCLSFYYQWIIGEDNYFDFMQFVIVPITVTLPFSVVYYSYFINSVNLVIIFIAAFYVFLIGIKTIYIPNFVNSESKIIEDVFQAVNIVIWVFLAIVYIFNIIKLNRKH
jgi:hypothetical protein